MQYSTNYSFKLPELTDPVNIADLDYNFSLIDSDLADWISPVCASLIAANIDTTLSVQGKAADAAAVGTAITGVMNALNTGLANLIDNTLSVSGKAADAKVTGDKLKYFGAHPTVTKKLFELWAYGRINGYSGDVVTASPVRRRITQYIGVEQGVFGVSVGTTLSQQVWVHAYEQNGTYVGSYKNGGTWNKSSTDYDAVTSFDFTLYPQYKFLLSLGNTDGSNISYGDEYIDIWFTVSTVQDSAAQISPIERKIADVIDVSTYGAPTAYEITSAGAAVRMGVLNGSFGTSTNTSYGTISSHNSSKVYYIQAAEDCAVWMDADFSTHRIRTSEEEPAVGSTLVWTGRFNSTLPTKSEPWIVKKNDYIAFSAQQNWTSSMHATLYVLPLVFGLKSRVPLSDTMTEQVQSMINENYYPGENMIRTSDVYAALDAIDAPNRITHTDISAAIDDNTPIRAYVINSSPKRLDYSYDVQPEQFYAKPKVLVMGTVHGDERGTPLFLIDFVKRLLSDESISDFAAACEWHIIPVVNVWGYNHSMIDGSGNIVWHLNNQTVTIVNNDSDHRGGVRNNFYDVNINRDFIDGTGFASDEAQAVRDYFLANDFVMCIDLHQWWTTEQGTIACFTSLVPYHSDKTALYRKGWTALTEGGKRGEDYIRAAVAHDRTKYQMAFLWGSESTSTTTRAGTASGYFAGAAGNTEHTSHRTVLSSTMETSMNMYFLSGTTTPYTPTALECGNALVQNVLLRYAKCAVDQLY